jgi:hypothetical protein
MSIGFLQGLLGPFGSINPNLGQARFLHLSGLFSLSDAARKTKAKNNRFPGHANN